MTENSLLTVIEVAELVRVTRQTVYNWIKDGGLPTVMAGSHLRIRREELDQWLERERAT